MCEYRVGVDLINELLRKSREGGGGDGLFKERYLNLLKLIGLQNYKSNLIRKRF